MAKPRDNTGALDTGRRFDATDYLSPTHLAVTPTPAGRVALVGSCLAEDWVNHLTGDREFPIDFVFNNHLAELPEFPPSGHPDDYAFLLIQISLRLTMSDTALLSLPLTDGAALRQHFETVCQFLAQRLHGLLAWNIRFGLPAFVTNFLVPQANSLGALLPRYELSNPVFFVESLNRRLAEALSGYRDVYLLDIDQVAAAQGKLRIQDDSILWNSHGAMIPSYPPDFSRMEPLPALSEVHPVETAIYLQAVWNLAKSMFRTLRGTDQVKLVVVDLDDTLWKGVLADQEDVGPEMVENWHFGVVEALLYLKQRGILLAILSKNDEEIVRAAWARIFLGRLALDDFVVRYIDWNPKPDNMRQILAQINVLPESVVFIDDNPVERAAMRAAFPGIRVIGQDPYAVRRILLWSAETQSPFVTGDSSRRSELLQAKLQRDALQPTLPREEFLQSLELRVLIHEIYGLADARFNRALELLNKTNQFNTTGNRWQRERLAQHLAAGGRLFSFEASDRFADHGTVGVIVLAGRNIVQQVMSCRVFGLDIEVAVLAELSCLLGASVGSPLTVHLVTTNANQPALRFFARFGATPAPDVECAPLAGLCERPTHIHVESRVTPRTPRTEIPINH